MKKSKLIITVISAFLGLSSLHAANPKYVFVFVGDGMSYPQIQSAAYYAGKDAAGIVDVVKKSENPSDSPEMKALSFYQFPVAGSASTYDATSFAPDSASTATSIFTGYKTHSSSINVDITKKIKYRTIAEQLRDQKKYKIGVISTVNLNHATPAATYAHQASRKSNYAIGEELVSLIRSAFDAYIFLSYRKIDRGHARNLMQLLHTIPFC